MKEFISLVNFKLKFFEKKIVLVSFENLSFDLEENLIFAYLPHIFLPIFFYYFIFSLYLLKNLNKQINQENYKN
jgi:hypothetical protein